MTNKQPGTNEQKPIASNNNNNNNKTNNNNTNSNNNEDDFRINEVLRIPIRFGAKKRRNKP